MNNYPFPLPEPTQNLKSLHRESAVPRTPFGSGADDDNSLMDGVHSDLARLEAFIRSRDNLAIQADLSIEAADASMLTADPVNAIRTFFRSDEVDLFILAFAGGSPQSSPVVTMSWCIIPNLFRVVVYHPQSVPRRGVSSSICSTSWCTILILFRVVVYHPQSVPRRGVLSPICSTSWCIILILFPRRGLIIF